MSSYNKPESSYIIVQTQSKKGITEIEKAESFCRQEISTSLSHSLAAVYQVLFSIQVPNYKITKNSLTSS